MGDFLSGILNIVSQPIILGELNLPFSLLQLVWRFLLPLAGIILAYILLFHLLKRILKRTNAPELTKHRLQRWIRLFLRLLVLTGALVLFSNLLGARGAEFLGNFIKFINEPLFTAGNTTISIITLMLLIPVFYLSSLAGQSVQMLLKKSIFPQVSTLDEAKQFSIANLARYTTMALVFFFLLSIIGIDFSAIGALLAVLGIGVGFGLQDLVANFFAGVVIIFARQIKEKDRIVVDGHEGNVSSIRLLSTSLTTLQNENLIIPNSHITNSVIHNASYSDREVIVVNNIEVHYKSDLDRVMEVMIQVGDANPYKKKRSESKTLVRSFNSSGIEMELRIWISDVMDKVEAYSWNNLELWRSFRNAGIEIPYPQMDLYVKEIRKDSSSE